MIKAFYNKTRNWIIDVAGKSWKGAAIGATIAMVFYLTVMGTYVKTWLPAIIDILLVIVMIFLLFFLVSFLSKQLFKIIRGFNPVFVGVLMATLGMTFFLPNSFFSRHFILFGLVCGAIAGFAVVHGIKKPISIILLSLVVALNGMVFYFLLDSGSDMAKEVSEEYWNQQISSIDIDDPSKCGNYEVKALTYGSGDDKQRPEYADDVTIETMSVDATPFFDKVSGWDHFVRKMYWGFNAKNYPVNGRVWYPSGKGPFPLVLIVHGNHQMDEYSDPGYAYLGQLMASRGYIFVSVDENFLNGGWFGDYNQSEIFTRAWLLLKHLENWREWNKTEGNVFYQNVDMDNIVLIGHSRGGATVAVASEINKLKRYHADAKQEFNFDFSIKGIVQIAPNDPYKPRKCNFITPENVNYLVLQGGYDQDMYWFLGNRVYNRVRFTDGHFYFKSALYIYRANHGQFNTVWGRKDYGIPALWLLNTKPIMKGEEQRKISKLYISAFLDATLKGNQEYIQLFKDYRNAKKLLPKDYYINQYEDTEFKYIADFQEDIDVNTATCNGCTIDAKNLKTWNENSLLFRNKKRSSQSNCGVYLGWDQRDTTINGFASYNINIPDSVIKGLELDTVKNFFFFICNNKDDLDTVNFSIELLGKGARVKKAFHSFKILPPPLKSELTKSDYLFSLNKKPVERVLQFVEIPVKEFTRENKALKISELDHIRFVFDQTTSGEIILDKIGFN